LCRGNSTTGGQMPLVSFRQALFHKWTWMPPVHFTKKQSRS